jgi:hypothetical protein
MYNPEVVLAMAAGLSPKSAATPGKVQLNPSVLHPFA